MNKINVICERNEETNQISIKTIVLFKDGEEPKVKNYDGILDLIPVVELAAENGVDLVGENGIGPALENKTLNIVLTSNKKAMSELKAEILEARITNEAGKGEKVLTKTMSPSPAKSSEESSKELPAQRILDLAPDARGPLGDNPILRKTDEHFDNNRGSFGQDSRFRGPASNHGAPTANNSIFSTMEDEDVKTYELKRTPVKEVSVEENNKELPAQRILDLAPDARGPLGDNPILRKTDEHFDNDRGSLGQDSRFRGPASNHGAPTANNSVFGPVESEKESKIIIGEKTPAPKGENESKIIIGERTPAPKVEDESKIIIGEKTPAPKGEEKPKTIIDETKPEVKGEGKTNPIIVEKVIAPKNEKENIGKKPGGTRPPKPVEKLVIVPSRKEKELSDEEMKEIVEKVEKENNVKIRPTSRLRNFFRRTGTFLLGVVTGVLGTLGVGHLFHNKKSTPPPQQPPLVVNTQEPTVTPGQVNKPTPTPNVTVKPVVTPNPTINPTQEPTNHQRIINQFIQDYKVPHNTQLFLYRPDVLGFLSAYQNEVQLKEVLSALSYGYEANILNTKDGNFRLDADGVNYLHSFTKDFMAAKALVNNYDSKQLLTLFGGKDITYEILINGFQNYCHTVMTYGLNATEALPFHYLTNNNLASTTLMNDLFTNLAEVNRNRANGTLTSKHTDDFIAKTFNIFVENNQSTNVSEATKTVLAAMVDSFVMMQSNVANGQALYLQEDRGYAKAGINLAEIDGQFTFRHKDKTTYEFTSLFDVMNHEYGNKNDRCVLEQERMIQNIITMSNDTTTSTRQARERLAQALYNNGLGFYAEEVLENKVNENLLLQIQKANPIMMQDVEAYRASVQSNKNNLVGFQHTHETIDALLGIRGRTNSYNNLINVRRARALNAKYNNLGGKVNTGVSTQTQTTPTPNVTTTTTTEQVTTENMTVVEQLQAQQEENRLREEEAAAHQAQAEQIEEAKEDLRDGVEAGMTQEQLEEVAAESGIDLDENYQQNMIDALREQREAEERRLQIEREIAERNAQAEREAEARRLAEEEAQRRRAEEEAALINQGLEPETVVDQTDDEVVVEDEMPYTETRETTVEPGYDPQLDPNFSTEDEIDYSGAKERIEALKAMAMELPVDVEMEIGGRAKVKTAA